jgi:hypothetical protein
MMTTRMPLGNVARVTFEADSFGNGEETSCAWQMPATMQAHTSNLRNFLMAKPKAMAAVKIPPYVFD